MSVDTLKKRVLEVKAGILKGQFTTQEELEKEMKKW